MNKLASEQTLVLIKPDALKNSLTGYVLSQLSEFHTGLRFAATKIVNVHKMLAEEHYAEHKGKVFFPSLLDYIMGIIHYPDAPWKRRVIAIVYQGPGATQKIRDLCGPTNPHNARDEKPGSIRAMGTVVNIKDDQGNIIGDRMDNLIHASATNEEAEREIKLWFKPIDIPPLMRPYPVEVCDCCYYYKDNRLLTEYEQGSFSFLAPGNVVWQSDMEILRAKLNNQPSADSLQTVVAKYLINAVQEN